MRMLDHLTAAQRKERDRNLRRIYRDNTAIEISEDAADLLAAAPVSQEA